MNILGVTPILNVSNLLETFAWFESLGWRKHWEHGDPPTFGAVISGHTEIFLCQDCQGARGGSLPRQPWDNPAAVDAAYAHALALGISAPLPPTDMPWNVRECHIRHPDGHTFRISARLEEE